MNVKLKHMLRLGSAACLLLASAQVASQMPLDMESDGRLFAAQGSNTVGAHLMRDLLLGYFKAQNVAEVEVVPLPRENEYRVQGVWNGRMVFVDVAAHGSGTGFRGLQQGDAHIAMSSRRITPAEVERLKDFGEMQDYVSEHVIAIDGLAVIVSPRNPVAALSLSTLSDIFSGNISNWAEVGGRSGPVNIYARDENSGTWDTFNSLVMGRNALASHARRFESNDALSDLVANDPNGIGFVGLGSVRESSVLAVHDEGTKAQRPAAITVATEDYILARRLFLYSPRAKQTASVRAFLGFVQSDAGQEIVPGAGFVSQNLISVRLEAVAEGPQDYLDLVNGAERLSVNLRFAEGSAQLDNKARRDIVRIADYMRRPENQNKRVVLVGFGDEIDNHQRADVLSRLRATAVKSALFRMRIGSDPVLGLGGEVPVARNQDEGRLKNRRVEVWVRPL